MPENTTSLKQSVFNKGRKDKFLLVFTLPDILKTLNTDLLEERAQELVKQDAMQYSIWGSPVPEVSVPSKSLRIDGQTYKVTSQSRDPYSSVIVNFTIDNRFSNYWLIWKWLDVLNDAKNSGMSDYFNQWEEGKDKTPRTLGRDKAAAIRESLTKQSKLEEHTMTYKEDPIYMKNNFLAYQTIMTIYGLDEYNQKMIQFDYYNAFPTKLAGIDYSYRDHDEITSNFQFEFSQMHPKLIGPAF
jgi:hypothetical protein